MTGIRSPQLQRFGLLLIFALALTVRSAHLDWGFPAVHEEATPAREAVGFWGEPGGSLSLNPEFFKYPSLTLYVNFLAQAGWYLVLSVRGEVESLNEFRQVLREDFTSVVLLARWIQALLGALVTVPVFVFARRLAGPLAGWVAAALVAILPMAVIESRLVAPDAALLLFSAAALASATRIAADGDRGAYLWTGLWIGLATSAKYPGALLFAPLFAAHTVVSLREKRGPAGVVFSSLTLQAAFLAGLVFAVTSPYVLLDASTALQDIAFERRHMALGHLGREDGRAWSYYLGQVIPRGWSTVVAIGAVLGAVLLAARKPTRTLWWPGAAFAGVTVLIVGSWTMGAPRYVLPLVPVVVAWCAATVAWLVTRTPRTLGVVLAALAAISMIAAPGAGLLRELSHRGRVDSRMAAGLWIEENVPSGSAILVERYGPEPDPSTYHVLYLPFHSVTPHLYDPAYSPALYTAFDFLVLSSEVNARYLARPREYPAQVQFYAALEQGFQEEVRFSTGEHLGPEIRILRRRSGVPLKELSEIPSAFFEELKGIGPVAEYFSALGALLDARGRGDLGAILMQHAVEMDAENATTWGNLGAVHLKNNRYEDALQAFRRAREVAPRDAKVAYNLATLYQRMGEGSQAEAAYGEAIRDDPSFESAYLGLARVLIEEDHYSRARLVLKEFLQRFPRSSKRGQAEAALEQLSSMGPGRP